MTTNISGSAKIYMFPARGRFAPTGVAEPVAAAAHVVLPPGAVFVPSGSSWYHDEAISDAIVTAGQGRKN
jgi:hypothetical protein